MEKWNLKYIQNGSECFWTLETYFNIIPEFVAESPCLRQGMAKLLSPDEGREILPKIQEFFDLKRTLWVECVIRNIQNGWSGSETDEYK